VTRTIAPRRRELQLSEGVLAFPLTPFSADGEIDVPTFTEHLAHLLSFNPGALFVACGTGEFAALTVEEHRLLVEIAVRVTAGAVNVLAGVGMSVAVARVQARNARDAGADGLLVLPPYLTAGPQQGLEAYVRGVAAASDLPIVVYQRGIARYEPDTIARLRSLPQFVGFKDGLGDIEHMLRIKLAAGDDVLYFNGLPTAELQASAYRAIGTPLYSSAVFAMAPEIATAFFRAWHRGDIEVTHRLLREFYVPLAAIRDRVPGYAVALIKAGAALRGSAVGSVRAPLVDPTPADLAALQLVLDRGLDLAKGVA
jgi:5-dehydro-4-deoxyglucarate dehydratase